MSPRVSLCLIVKNEEANLLACLTAAADLVAEIVVVDTGSTDHTKDIAAHFGAHIVDFPWRDDFAAARNEALNHATGDWIFWLDADDRLNETNRASLRELFASLKNENVAYLMKCVCSPDLVTGSRTVLDHARLFRRHPAIRWHYRVHEQIVPAIQRTGGVLRWSNVVIRHIGYQDAALLRRKRERNLRLLQIQDAEQPGDPVTLCHLGNAYHLLDRHAEALSPLLRSEQLLPPENLLGRKLYETLTPVLYLLGRKDEALTVCRRGRSRFPLAEVLLFYEGQLLLEGGQTAMAEACLRRLLDPKMEGVGRHLVRHKLAVLYCQQGRLAEAETEWRSALMERPDYVVARQGLAELLQRTAKSP